MGRGIYQPPHKAQSNLNELKGPWRGGLVKLDSPLSGGLAYVRKRGKSTASKEKEDVHVLREQLVS
jgi:hypothetical protein